MKAKIVFLSTALAGALAAASAVHAVPDVKVHSGSDCKAITDNSAGGASVVSSGVSTTNISAGNVTVECPIARDNHSNTNGLKSLAVRVLSDGANTLTCVIGSIRPNGTVLAVDTNSTTNNTVTPLPLSMPFSVKNGTYVMECILPPGTSVVNYRVVEF